MRFTGGGAVVRWPWRVSLLKWTARCLGFGHQSVGAQQLVTGEYVVVGLVCAQSVAGLQVTTMATAQSLMDNGECQRACVGWREPLREVAEVSDDEDARVGQAIMITCACIGACVYVIGLLFGVWK